MKKIFLNFSFIFLFAFFISNFAHSQSGDTFKPLGDLITSFTENVVISLMALFGAAAIATFFYGIVIFIKDADNDKERENGKKFMLWSLVAIFVMVSVWGIVRTVQSLVGINKNDNQVNIKPICVEGLNCASDNKYNYIPLLNKDLDNRDVGLPTSCPDGQITDNLTQRCVDK